MPIYDYTVVRRTVSPAGVQQEEDSAKARRSAAQAEDARTSGQASAGKSSAAQSK
jgi:hypothetical protein